MARSLHRLSDRTVRTVGVGRSGDGGGHYLQVTAGKDGQLNRSWLFLTGSGSPSETSGGMNFRVSRLPATACRSGLQEYLQSRN
jgi:hypothetical protein